MQNEHAEKIKELKPKDEPKEAVSTTEKVF
jgi:hypothetical protein